MTLFLVMPAIAGDGDDVDIEFTTTYDVGDEEVSSFDGIFVNEDRIEGVLNDLVTGETINFTLTRL